MFRGATARRDMQANQIAAILLPSKVVNEHDPGHMAVKFFAPDGEPALRGFRFTPDDLPIEFQSSEMWREFFNREDGKAPGPPHLNSAGNPLVSERRYGFDDTFQWLVSDSPEKTARFRCGGPG